MIQAQPLLLTGTRFSLSSLYLHAEVTIPYMI